MVLESALVRLFGAARMRVCHVCSGHSADDGRVFHRACVSLAAAGYDVHLIARARGTEPFVDQGVTIHPLPESASRRERLSRRSQVAQLATGLKADVFHVHEPELLGPVIARAGSRPVIWDVHESYLDVLMDRKWIPRALRPVARLAWDLEERRLVRRCAAVVAATERVAQRYGALHDNVVTVSNYPDLSEMVGLPSVARNGATCVYAGTILPNRGLAQVFAALAVLRERGVSLRLELAGKGSEEYLRVLLSEAERLGVRELVSYHGVLSKRDALLLQLGASIGVVPGLPVGNNLAAVPVKMVECMALGLPLVFSDFPSHREVAGLYGAGIGVDPTDVVQIADALEHLVRNPDLARKMGENGRRAVQTRFNWDVERVKLLSLYREILGPFRAG